MNACRLSHLEALALALSSNKPGALETAKEINAVARFIHDTFLDPDGGLAADLRAMKDSEENPPPDHGDTSYMKLDGLPDEQTETQYDA